MSEQQLKDFGARAETLVDVPDFAELDRRGAHLQTRRRLGVAAGLALVLAVAGAGVTQHHRSSADHDPVHPPPPTSTAVPYPGNTMTTLDEGSYALQSCCVPGRSTSDFASNPVAELAVPRGWNAWVGPNRFDGHAPGRTNKEALSHLTWYVGALLLEVDAVNTQGCGNPDEGDLRTADDLVAALRRAFSMRVIQGPVQDRRFGYPATRIRVRVTHEAEDCRRDPAVFHTGSDGMIGYLFAGNIADIWVVDVDGYPIYVQRAWSPNAPRSARRELDSIIDSVRFSFRE